MIKPQPDELFWQAGGGTEHWDPQKFRELLREHWVTPASGLPAPESMNWELLHYFALRKHPLIRDADPEGVDKDLSTGLIELLVEAKQVHHLLDFIGIPRGYSLDTTDIGARTLLAARAHLELDARLARIAEWHTRESGSAGTVGDYCVTCARRWPCDTYRMATGTYTEEDNEH